MYKKMGCPICKKKVLFVGVHDDEGNFHGLVGCEYENDPWSGLSYALHHDGRGDCPLCTDGAYSTMGGMLFDTAEDAISALSQPNEPLTLEQLRQMNGDPVYIPEIECWALVKREQFTLLLTFSDGKQCPASEWYEQVGPVYSRQPEGEET